MGIEICVETGIDAGIDAGDDTRSAECRVEMCVEGRVECSTNDKCIDNMTLVVGAVDGLGTAVVATVGDSLAITEALGASEAVMVGTADGIPVG